MPDNKPNIAPQRESFGGHPLTDWAMIVVDPTGKMLTWNKSAELLLRFKTANEVEQGTAPILPIASVAEYLQQDSDHLNSRAKPFRFRDWVKPENSVGFWVRGTLEKLAPHTGAVKGYCVMLQRETDIEEPNSGKNEFQQITKNLEARLQQSQVEIADYKHALDESSIVAITDQKGIIRYVNENFCRISKYTRDELIGQDHRLINSGFHSKDFIRNLWVTIARGLIWRGELKNKAKDGSFYWVDTTIVPFLNEKGKPYQYLAIRSDISKRKMAEEQLRKINEDLESKVNERTFELTDALEREKALNEMKSRFVSMASHEFRTPLSAILSSAALLEHYQAPGQAEKREKHIKRIKASVRNLTALLDDFLSIEKLEQGRVETHPETFDLKVFLADVAEEVDGMLRKKSQTIELLAPENTPVRQDKKILCNILLNLLSNSSKYSAEEKKIQLSVTVNKALLVFTVRDQGIGIPANAQSQIFSKFHRAGNVIHIQGTGLGLHIVKRYVELLRGTVSFTSAEGVGTHFEVTVPILETSGNS